MELLEPAHGGDESGSFESRETLTSLQTSLERLRLLVIQTIDALADGVLGQIQTSRGIVEQIDALLGEVRQVTAQTPTVTASESHLREVSAQIEEAIRDMPESNWDTYAHICAQLARMLALHQQNE